jgi:hypothetical protein
VIEGLKTNKELRQGHTASRTSAKDEVTDRELWRITTVRYPTIGYQAHKQMRSYAGEPCWARHRPQTVAKVGKRMIKYNPKDFQRMSNLDRTHMQHVNCPDQRQMNIMNTFCGRQPQ